MPRWPPCASPRLKKPIKPDNPSQIQETPMSAEKNKKPSRSARHRAARLYAVQTLYGLIHTANDIKEAVADALAKSETLEIDGEELVAPDKILFQKIIFGYNARKDDIKSILQASLTSRSGQETETLLESILSCGIYELLAHPDVDAPIIINDYLEVAHGFYEQSQVNLINGVLDKASKALRN